MKKEIYSKKEIARFQKIVLSVAKEVIVFDTIKYIETKRFNIESTSTYVVFGLFNKNYACWNSATYDVVHNAIDFSVHRVKC